MCEEVKTRDPGMRDSPGCFAKQLAHVCVHVKARGQLSVSFGNAVYKLGKVAKWVKQED